MHLFFSSPFFAFFVGPFYFAVVILLLLYCMGMFQLRTCHHLRQAHREFLLLIVSHGAALSAESIRHESQGGTLVFELCFLCHAIAFCCSILLWDFWDQEIFSFSWSVVFYPNILIWWNEKKNKTGVTLVIVYIFISSENMWVLKNRSEFLKEI